MRACALSVLARVAAALRRNQAGSTAPDGSVPTTGQRTPARLLLPCTPHTTLVAPSQYTFPSRETHSHTHTYACTQIPADAALAARVLAQKQSEEAERSHIKALVLEANQREEAEEAAAAAAAREARAAAFRRGGRGGGGQLYRRPGGRQQQQQAGPQLTIARHVNQLK